LLPFFFPPVGPVIAPGRRDIRQCAHGPQPDRPYRWMIALDLRDRTNGRRRLCSR
jgi:hypothetical protein